MAEHAAGISDWEEGEGVEDAMVSLAYSVHRHPLNREIMYAILRMCAQERGVNVVENQVLEHPEYAQATQNPFRLICFLVDHGGLELIRRDSEGVVITDERASAMDEDALDDAIASEALVTTEAGRRLLALAEPKRRMGLLLDSEPSRRETYLEVLGFIRDEHPSYGRIKELLAGRDILRAYLDGHWVDVQPSVFVDKLEGAGMIRWEDGWTLTEAGESVLEDLLSAEVS